VRIRGYFSPGHAGVMSNEIVDRLATKWGTRSFYWGEQEVLNQLKNENRKRHDSSQDYHLGRLRYRAIKFGAGQRRARSIYNQGISGPIINVWWNERIGAFGCCRRTQQTTIFRLRTRHCRLNAHLHKLNAAPTPHCTLPKWPSHSKTHTADMHTPQKSERQIWPREKSLNEKLWGR
jgi:hypothetical protein